jgi:dihydrolipoamide dehydrogenase
LHKLGSDVIILEGMKTILPGFDKAMVQMATRLLKKQGVTIHTETRAKSADIRGDRVIVKADIAGKEETFDVDAVLISVGRRPNSDELGLDAIGVERTERGFIKVNRQQQTSVPHIYAIGDVVGEPMLAHKAYYEAKVAAEAISGLPSATDYQAMPFVIFSDPEMASVGLTKDAAKEQGIDVITARFPFQANGRALSLNKAEGFVHIVAERATQHVLGLQIVGPEASTLIAEAALAIEMGATLEDLSLTVHPHPTLSETLAEAAEVALGRGTHLLSK